jgi:hypothetical protein
MRSYPYLYDKAVSFYGFRFSFTRFNIISSSFHHNQKVKEAEEHVNIHVTARELKIKP